MQDRQVWTSLDIPINNLCQITMIYLYGLHYNDCRNEHVLMCVGRDQWKGYVPPYTPKFTDGWNPEPGWFTDSSQDVVTAAIIAHQQNRDDVSLLKVSHSLQCGVWTFNFSAISE